MTYNEESYVLDTLKELKETIRSPSFKQLVKETHENNIMLRQIIKYLNREAFNADKENEEDFIRNVLANMFSNQFEFINNNNHKHK